MAQTPEEMAAAMIANLPEKTGKSLDEWKKVVASSGLEKHGEIVGHLKTEHGVTHGYANLISHEYRSGAAGGAPPAGGDLVDRQYSGAKADLRPVYEAILTGVKSFGSDVEVSPKKTYVSFRRSKQFALVQPSTRTRVDVGIQLKGIEPGDVAKKDGARLEESGSFNSMVSHRVRVTRPEEVDDELLGWLRAAYGSA